jgi:twitching motility two-component system response regulator PilH
MPVFDLFKRLVGTNSAPVGERRDELRVRASLGARVLVVDDSATIRAVLGKMLAQDGYEVLMAPDGETAVTLAQAQFPDLIFVDIVLPGLSGFAALRALRRDSRTHTTPIIMMSGNQQATEQFYVQRFGADGFVKKPFGRADVFHAVRSLVQAGRLPARVETPPVDAIPAGMTQEEWNAIPDIGMPDEAHMQPALTPSATPPPAAPQPSPAPAVSPPARVQVVAAPVASAAAWSTPASSLPMRPTISADIQASVGNPSAPLLVHLHPPRPPRPQPGGMVDPALDDRKGD